MKNLTLYIMSILVILGMSSCQDEVDLDIVAQEPTEEIEFTNPILAEYRLSEETSDNIAERFLWNPVSFGTETAVGVTYSLLATTTGILDSTEILGSTSETNLAITVGQLLSIAEDLGLDSDPETTDAMGNPNNSGQIFLALVATVGTGANALSDTSDIQPINITVVERTSNEEPPLVNLYLVGTALPYGYNYDANNIPLFRSQDNPNQFSYTGYLLEGEFKLLEMIGAWRPQWGTNDGTTLTVNDGDNEPGAISVSAEGYYTLEVDLDAMTFTLTPYDASAADTYTTIGILGDGTNSADADNDGTPDGWQADMDLTQSDFNPHLWYMNSITLEDGFIKFRANDAWDVNWGITFNGDNIPVTAGTYNVWFNDLTGSYLLISVE